MTPYTFESGDAPYHGPVEVIPAPHNLELVSRSSGISAVKWRAISNLPASDVNLHAATAGPEFVPCYETFQGYSVHRSSDHMSHT